MTNGQAELEVRGPNSADQPFPCGTVGTAGECSFIATGGSYNFHAQSSSIQYGQQVNYTLAYLG